MAKYMRDKVPGMMVDNYYISEMDKAVANIPKEDKNGSQCSLESTRHRAVHRTDPGDKADTWNCRRAHHGGGMGSGASVCDRGSGPASQAGECVIVSRV